MEKKIHLDIFGHQHQYMNNFPLQQASCCLLWVYRLVRFQFHFVFQVFKNEIFNIESQEKW